MQQRARLRGKGELRLAGALAAGSALGALWIVSLLWPALRFPPGALANRLVRLVPAGVSTFFIELLGHWALRLLGLGVMLAALALGAEVLARTARGEEPRPWLAAGILAAVSAVAGALDPASPPSAAGLVVTHLGAAAVYASSARRLHAFLVFAEQPDEGRRRALKAGLGTAAGLALGGGVLGWLARRLGGPNTDVALVAPATPAAVPPRPPFPAIAGLTPEVTSVEDHYVVDINLFKPSIEAAGWTLKVHGLVERPLELTFAELQERFEVVEEHAVLTCVSNQVGGDLVGHSVWGGVRLADVLELAGVQPGALDVVARGADGYADSIALEVAMRPDVLISLSQNGEPLTQEHGFPCRLRVPPIYGMKNVKWLQEIEVVGSDFRGYWQSGDGWSDTAVVRTQSRIDVAGDERRAAVGRATWIAGVAWAGDRGIARVEVSTDAGKSWHDAELRAPIGPLSWRQWAYRWTPERPGTAVVMVRATDGAGETQTERRAPPHPAGATGYHSVIVRVAEA